VRATEPHRIQRRLATWYRTRSPGGPLRRTVRRVGRAAERLETSTPGAWFDLQTNGEAALVHALARDLEAKTILDVGANQGEWYRVARQAFPHARIVCVEIAPPLWPILEQMITADPKGELLRAGLGVEDADVELRWYPDNPALTTTIPYPHQARHEIIAGHVRGVAGFLAEYDITRVDVAKVDVEGAELPIVQGLEPMMAAGEVGVVQFEYGRANILTRTLLRDYAELGHRTGYRLGRLTPGGVTFVDYNLDQEDFRPRNMVLCRPDLVDVLTSFGD
jgi:FkbM family methyltransferase